MGTISKAWQDAMNGIERKIKEACEAKGHTRIDVRFSAYDSDEFDTPIDNLNEVALKGKVKFIDEGNFWEGVGDGEYGESYKPYESGIIENPTWLDVCVAANKMIQTTNDRHHVYVEQLYDVYQEEDGGVLVAKIGMGS